MSGTTGAEAVSWVEKVSKLGAAAVTLAIFVLLGAELFISARVDTGSNQTFTNIVEVTKSLAILAAGYWMGSSKSSQAKDDTIAAAVKAPSAVASATALRENTAASEANTESTDANTAVRKP